MAKVHANEIDVYYERHGAGDPLLLIMGWGGNAATWRPQIPELAKQYEVIAFDNRGAGRTSAPEGPYSVHEMARDTVGLLDALDLPWAHVLGISMGGMIAQELALGYPERVGALVLGCTSPGGPRAHGIEQLLDDIQAFKDLSREGGPDLEWFTEFLRRLWTKRALARYGEHLQDFVLSLIRFPPTPHGLCGQADAIAAHDTYDRLPQIGRPTLVISGTEDELIDPHNSPLLARRIPGAELRLFAGLKHAFHLERPTLVNAVIIEFIERVSERSSSGAVAR